jgi:hypothetical protein
MTAERATGVVQGSNTRNRKNHLPRKSALSTKARTVESTTTHTCDMAVNRKLFRSAVPNTGSSIAARNVDQPTKRSP